MSKYSINITGGGLIMSSCTTTEPGAVEGSYIDQKYTKRFYQPLSEVVSLTSESIPENTLCSKKFEVKSEVTVEELGARLNRRYSNDVYVLGIYSLDKEGIPENLIVQTGEFNAGISGFQAQSVAPTLLVPGVYALAYHSNETMRFRVASNSLTYPNFGFDFSRNGLTLNTYRVSLPYSSQLPAIYPATGAFQSKGFPLVVFKLQ